MKQPTSVLFICIHNSARSQMAEAYLKHLGGNRYHSASAGLEPGTLNPLVVTVMLEDGIDISENLTKDVFAIHKSGATFDYVITVCDAKNAESCPIFPAAVIKQAWWFDDPSQFAGTPAEKMEMVRRVRDEIKGRVKLFIEETVANNPI